VLTRYCDFFRKFEIALLQEQWVLALCLMVWCGCFLFMTFVWHDWPLIGLLIIAVAVYFIGYAVRSATDALTLLFGVTLGKGTQFLLKSGRWKAKSENDSIVSSFLIGLIVLLALASLWQLDNGSSFQRLRWMGLWNNPNDYGMLMSVGVVLAAGLLAGSQKSEVRSQKLLSVALFIAAGLMAIGLLFSYSRGAWLGTVVGLLYLTKSCGRFKWQFVLPGIFIAATMVWFFWNATSDSSPWYVKRMDLSRPSVQHRIAAWKAGFKIMRDHPFGVGWNKAVEMYEKNYSPPEDGASAITTNDYLMIGTQLGIPALLCFVAYVALCFRKIGVQNSGFGIKTTCRAAALAMLVEFWLDGGLFKLATASVFWISLELGASPPQCSILAEASEISFEKELR
jgi:hypothetical protein